MAPALSSKVSVPASAAKLRASRVSQPPQQPLSAKAALAGITATAASLLLAAPDASAVAQLSTVAAPQVSMARSSLVLANLPDGLQTITTAPEPTPADPMPSTERPIDIPTNTELLKAVADPVPSPGKGALNKLAKREAKTEGQNPNVQAAVEEVSKQATGDERVGSVKEAGNSNKGAVDRTLAWLRPSFIVASLPDGLQTVTTAKVPTPADPMPSTQQPIDIPTNTELLKAVADPVPSPGKGALNKLANREAKTEGQNPNVQKVVEQFSSQAGGDEQVGSVKEAGNSNKGAVDSGLASLRPSFVVASLDGLQTTTTAPEPTPADPKPSTQNPIEVPTNSELLRAVADPVPSPGKGPLKKLAKREEKSESETPALKKAAEDFIKNARGEDRVGSVKEAGNSNKGAVDSGLGFLRPSFVVASLPDGLQTVTTAPEPTPADPKPSTQRPIDIPTNTELLKAVADPVPSPGKGPLNKLAKREAKTEAKSEVAK